VWKKRLGGDWSASPVCASGMMFNVDESGEVTVLAAGPEFKLLGKFPLGDQSRSTPAIADGRIYFRTFHRLACVQARS
jgi:outer membrane protein assembly factor BamB